jgi:hypothetical protein
MPNANDPNIDIAIKKLRPRAFFVLENNRITQWYDPAGQNPPTEEEIFNHLNTESLNISNNELQKLYKNGKSLETDLIETPSSKERIKICKSCNSFIKPFLVCKKCFCYMPWKTKIEKAVCPLNKW